MRNSLFFTIGAEDASFSISLLLQQELEAWDLFIIFTSLWGAETSLRLLIEGVYLILEHCNLYDIIIGGVPS
jgi:hypothetical protein